MNEGDIGPVEAAADALRVNDCMKSAIAPNNREWEGMRAPPIRILIADADARAAAAAAALLIQAGFSAATACSGEDALASIESFRPDMALVDTRLGRDEGLDVAAAMRRASPRLITVAVSADDDVNTALDALRNGAFDFLKKPVDPDVLAGAIRRAGERLRTEAEREAHLEALSERNSRLDAFNAGLRRVSQSINRLAGIGHTDDFAPAMLKEFIRSLHAERGCIYLASEGGLNLAAASAGSGSPPHWPVDAIGDTALRSAIERAAPVHLCAGEAIERRADDVFPSGDVLVFPFLGEDAVSVSGAAILRAPDGRVFSPGDIELGAILAHFCHERLVSIAAVNALAMRERQYRMLEGNLRDVVWAADSSGRLSYLSSSALTLFEAGKAPALGTPVLSIIPDDARRDVLRAVCRLMRGIRRRDVPADGDVTVQSPLAAGNGIVRWFETRISAAYDETGSFTGFIGVSRDISDRRRAEAEEVQRRAHLMQAGKLLALGSLVGGISHEINNPNQVLMSSAAAMEEIWQRLATQLDEHTAAWTNARYPEPAWEAAKEDAAHLFRYMKKETERIKRVVFDLRDFARGDTEAFDDRLNLSVIASQAVRILANPIAKATWHFGLEIAPDLPPVRGNGVRVQQVLIHLLQNACEALTSPEQAVGLHIRHDRPAGRIVMEVWDEGSGIAPERRDRLFDPFFTTRREAGHMGLGLFLALAIAEEHDGQVELIDRPQGGTRALFCIPAIAESG